MLRKHKQDKKLIFFSHKHKFIFLHTGKCGCKSINAALNSLIDSNQNVKFPADHPSLKDLNTAISTDGYNPNDYKLLTLVRNPYDRMVSWYYYALNTTKSFSGNFESFCEDRLANFSENLLPPYHQSDFIIRFESMQYDFDNFLSFFQFPSVELPHIQHGTHRPNRDYQSLFSSRSKIIVDTYFSEVIDRFGYEF